MGTTRPQWNRVVREAMDRAGITEQRELMEVVGVTEATVSRWMNGHAEPQNQKKRDEVLAKIARHRTAGVPSSLQFANDGEKIAYSLGVLHMAQAAKSELGRCLDAATSALLAPVSQPAPPAMTPTASEIAGIRATADARGAAPRPRPTRAR